MPPSHPDDIVLDRGLLVELAAASRRRRQIRSRDRSGRGRLGGDTRCRPPRRHQRRCGWVVVVSK